MLVKIETYFDGEFWCARGIGVDIFTQAETLDELMKNIREAVYLHFEDYLDQKKSITILTLSETEVTNVPEIASS